MRSPTDATATWELKGRGSGARTSGAGGLVTRTTMLTAHGERPVLTPVHQNRCQARGRAAGAGEMFGE